MVDPDLEALQGFYSRVIRGELETEQIFVHDMKDDDLRIAAFFADDLMQYHLEEMRRLQSDHGRLAIHMTTDFRAGDTWPEDFDTEGMSDV